MTFFCGVVAVTLTEEFDAGLRREERDFIGRVKTFAQEVVHPAAKEWEYTRRVPVEVLREACALGLGSVELPVEWGGMGLSFGAKVRMAEELARADLAFAFSLVQHHNALVRIAESAPAGVARRLLPGLLAGEAIGCTAMSEAGAGSDFAALATRAVKVDGGWRLSGEKAWITNAAVAGVALVYAQTDPAAGNKGIACFLLADGMAGFSRPGAYELQAAHAAGVGALRMDDCFVPDEMLLYPPGSGFKAAMQGVNRARVHVTAMNAGMLRESLSLALHYGEQRRAFDQPLLAFQGLAWSLADVATDLEAMLALAYRAARQIDRGEDAQQAAAFAKKFGNEHALGGIAACMQAMGANGLRADVPLARHLAAAKLLCYTDGTVEMMNERLVHLMRKAAASA
ncbi:MAG: Acrylyl-CoA reductase [Paucimonas sp.]|nr:Acrylyl-CoA reductase [Paucimonas sp.]